MILESVTNSSSKTIHVVNFSASSYCKVGRGSQCEVRITDVSVSRHHSSFDLVYKTDKYGNEDYALTVCDEMSKFGTLVFMRRPIPVVKGGKVNIQVGRSIFTVQVQDRLNMFQRCCCLVKQLRRDESNAVVHYDEAKKHFPDEFIRLFCDE